MGFITKPFHLIYKRLGITGSDNASINYRGYLNEDWYVTQSFSSPRLYNSYLNYPTDVDSYINDTYQSTRDTSILVGCVAIPWASFACDMLWNVTVPSWSFSDIGVDTFTPITYSLTYRSWSVDLNTSKSFFGENLGTPFNYGVESYSVTSSWFMVDYKLIQSGSESGSANFDYLQAFGGTYLPPPVIPGAVYPTYINSMFETADPEQSHLYGYDVTYPTLSSNSTSSFDGQYFDLGGGAAITRKSISQSLVTMSLNISGEGSTAQRRLTRALKQRRLFFPTPYSGSGTTLGTDYWFKTLTGYNVSDIFNENGGIYNVQLTLKKSATFNDCYPDPGTYMSVFIHDVASPVSPYPSRRVAGQPGWYPPDNNIVKIGNGYGASPTLAFNDPQTGYRIEKFNFNVIQYGYPAQLCLEVSGSLADDKYFGIIVDDIQICKIGVTTDPAYIKHTSVATQTNQVNNPQYIYKPAIEEASPE